MRIYSTNAFHAAKSRFSQSEFDELETPPASEPIQKGRSRSDSVPRAVGRVESQPIDLHGKCLLF